MLKKFQDKETLENRFHGSLFDEFSTVFPDLKLSKFDAEWHGRGLTNYKGGWFWRNDNEAAMRLLYSEYPIGRYQFPITVDREALERWLSHRTVWDFRTAGVAIVRHVKNRDLYFSEADFSGLNIAKPFADTKSRLDRLRDIDAPWFRTFLGHDGRMALEETEASDSKAMRFLDLGTTETGKLVAGVAKGQIGFEHFEFIEGISMSAASMPWGPPDGFAYSEFLFCTFDYQRELKKFSDT